MVCAARGADTAVLISTHVDDAIDSCHTSPNECSPGYGPGSRTVSREASWGTPAQAARHQCRQSQTASKPAHASRLDTLA